MFIDASVTPAKASFNASRGLNGRSPPSMFNRIIWLLPVRLSQQGQPSRCPRRHSLISRMGPCSRTPSGPAVSIDCINRPDRRLHPTKANTSIYPLQRGSHPQRTSWVRRDVGCYGSEPATHNTGLGATDFLFLSVLRLRLLS